LNKLNVKNLALFRVTSDRNKAFELFGNNAKVTILICDGTVIKTAARVNPTYFVMQLANIKGKYSYKNMDKVIDQINTVPENKDYAYFENSILLKESLP
jgi:predicted transcriptional regulator